MSGKSCIQINDFNKLCAEQWVDEKNGGKQTAVYVEQDGRKAYIPNEQLRRLASTIGVDQFECVLEKDIIVTQSHNSNYSVCISSGSQKDSLGRCFSFNNHAYCTHISDKKIENAMLELYRRKDEEQKRLLELLRYFSLWFDEITFHQCFANTNPESNVLQESAKCFCQDRYMIGRETQDMFGNPFLIDEVSVFVGDIDSCASMITSANACLIDDMMHKHSKGYSGSLLDQSLLGEI